jgi:diguanylate cyclase (GGDEF)-like protein
LAQTNLADALRVAERVVAAMRAEPVATGEGGTLAFTASVGVAALPEHAGTPAILVTAADRALYAAKAAGRNRVVAAAP